METWHTKLLNVGGLFKADSLLSNGEILEDGRPASNVLENSCFYCSKVFINSNFLLQHIIRRHSDHLVNLHKKFKSSSDQKHCTPLIQALISHFHLLQEEVRNMQKTVESGFSAMEERETQPASDSTLKIAELRKSTSDDPLTVNSKIERDLASIKERQDELQQQVQTLQETVAELRNVKRTVSLMEDRIFENIKSSLLANVRNMVLSVLQENEKRHQMELSEIKAAVQGLEEAVALNSGRLSSPQHFLEVLKEHLAFMIPPKKGTPPKDRHSSEPSSLKSLRKKRSIHTLPSSPLLTRKKHHAHKRANNLLTAELNRLGISKDCKGLSNDNNSRKLDKFRTQSQDIVQAELHIEGHGNAGGLPKTKLQVKHRALKRANNLLTAELDRLGISKDCKGLSNDEYSRKLDQFRSQSQDIIQAGLHIEGHSNAGELPKAKLQVKPLKKTRFLLPPKSAATQDQVATKRDSLVSSVKGKHDRNARSEDVCKSLDSEFEEIMNSELFNSACLVERSAYEKSVDEWSSIDSASEEEKT